MRESSWSNIGTDVSMCKSMDEVLARSGLDYEVRKTPLMTVDGLEVANHVALRNDNQVLGVVSNKFGIVQNREAFEFVDYMGDDITYEKAGQTASGMVYVIARLAEVSVLGDSFVPHVIFRNGFNGKWSIAAAICPLRIVCQNQFSIAFKESPNTITIRHTADVKGKLEEAREVLRMSASYMTSLNDVAERMALKKLGPQEVLRAVNTLFPVEEDASPRTLALAERKRSALFEAYNADDNANYAGTAWGLVNAYADYMTHKKACGKIETRDENKFMRLSFDTPMNDILKVVA